MKLLLSLGIAGVLVMGISSGCGERPGGAQGRAFDPPGALTAFRSERELRDYLTRFVRTARPMAFEDAVMEPMAESSPSAGATAESVTNTQQAGVDEGGIVKVHGDHLVMLRRGRLFTVAIGDDQLRPVSTANAFGPDIDPQGTWYDELLVSHDLVVVIGFSYQRGGTEIGLFGIDDDGRLEYRSTYHLRSNDYYSSRNYASRLVGSRLILYTPLYLWGDDPTASFPAIRRWHPGATDAEFRRIAPATRIYRPGRPLHPDDEIALHTVTVCDLSRGDMDCRADAVLGPAGRVFYVSPEAVYVWVSDWQIQRGPRRAPATVYRIPLDQGAPTALGVSGSPVDQFSFQERGGYLNVVVRAGSRGDAMWSAERADGDVSLMRIPLDRFGDGSADVPRSGYRALPRPGGDAFQNRFVGDHLLYGAGTGWGSAQRAEWSAVFVVPVQSGGATAIALPHGVDRIEAMGANAVVIGSDGRDLHFTGIDLGGTPRAAQHYVSVGATQGELRSHGFFYKADGAESGILGLPLRSAGSPGYAHLAEGSASIVFIRSQGAEFRELGRLDARPSVADDGCQASCVDWYGNARPLFLRGRTFALLGYEIVEGAVVDNRIRERRRISYAPPAPGLARR